MYYVKAQMVKRSSCAAKNSKEEETRHSWISAFKVRSDCTNVLYYRVQAQRSGLRESLYVCVFINIHSHHMVDNAE